MSYTTNQSSLLYSLRSLMPERPLHQHEALRIAELQANRLLAAAGVQTAGTPSEIIAAFSNLKVSRRTDLPVSGYTTWFKPHWLIFLNGTEPSVRQRFSLFHELKHVIDHPFAHTSYPSLGTTTADKRAELICDYFAACVLMPKRFVKLAYFQGLHDPTELASMFGVSTVAMTYRLQQLGIIDRPARCDHSKLPRPSLPGYFRRAWDLTAIAPDVAQSAGPTCSLPPAPALALIT